MLTQSETIAAQWSEHMRRYAIRPEDAEFTTAIFIDGAILSEREKCMGQVCVECRREVPARPEPNSHGEVWQHWNGIDEESALPCIATPIRSEWARAHMAGTSR